MWTHHRKWILWTRRRGLPPSLQACVSAHHPDRRCRSLPPVFNAGPQNRHTLLHHPHSNHQQPVTSKSHVCLYISFKLYNITFRRTGLNSQSQYNTQVKTVPLLISSLRTPPLHSPVAKKFPSHLLQTDVTLKDL